MKERNIGRGWPVWTAIFMGLAGCGDKESGEPGSSASVPEEAEVGPVQDWRLYRADAEMRGISTEDLAPPLKLAWTYETPVEEGKRRPPIKASPVIEKGRAFFGSQDGNFYCVDVDSGESLWIFDAEGPVTAPGAVFDGRVFFGDTYGFIYALDAQTGEKIWKVETFDKIEGGINAFEIGGELRIFVGSHDTSLYCLKAESGETVWQLETGQPIISTPSIAVDLEAVVFGGCDAVLHVVSAETKEELFAVDVSNYIGNSAAIRDGIAYVADYGGEVLAVDLESQETIWKVANAGVEYHGSPAVTEKLLIVPGNDKRLVAYDRMTGDEVWSFTLPRSIESSPVVCGSAIWIGGMDGRLYAVDPESGKELWNYDLGAQIFASPAISRGTLVICGEDGVVYGFRAKAK